MGKGWGIGIGISAIVVIVGFIFFLGSGTSLDQGGSSFLDQGQSEPKEPSLYELSEEELKLLVVDWEYDELLRDISDYKGELITFRGEIFRSETIKENHYALTVWADEGTMIVEWKGNRLLDGDEIKVYGKVERVIEVGSMLASEWKSPYPVVTAVHIIRYV